MGAALFAKYPDAVATADRVLGYSVTDLCLENADQRLDRTEYTQPALFLVNALSYMEKLAEGGRPDIVAGHSLGEYSALFAAGAFDLATGIALVKRRGELMARSSAGGMAAVMGLTESEVAEVLRAEGASTIDIANLNGPNQIVLAGPREDLLACKEPFLAAKARSFVSLRVSAAFHSRYMADTANEFRVFLRDIRMSPLQFPVVSNVDALPHEVETIADKLVAQIVSPVRWTETVRRLMSLDDPQFEEVGPGKVLAGLIRQIQKVSEPLAGSFLGRASNETAPSPGLAPQHRAALENVHHGQNDTN
ncbi:ACP S-malonyltransferase [Pendulispora brunnea]|uniref:Malonyl CoA-acyl carrier protein transacylase n=2 Tax=Pendulispora brunnea TaxID=2905690 RepID=A0ABZ2K3S9_9BACT